jgi:Capsule polysaccharide biosynthesis protein
MTASKVNDKSSPAKVLFICKGEYYGFMPRIAEALLREYGWRPSVVTFATPTSELPQLRIFEATHNVAAHLKRDLPLYDLENCIQYLERLEPYLGDANFNVMIHSDRIIRKYSFENILKIIASVCRFWEKLFTESAPDIIVGEVACASEWIGWSLAQQRKIPYLIPYPSPLPGRFTFIRGPQGMWETTEAVYEQAKERRLQPEERRIAEEYLLRFRTQHVKAPHHLAVARPPVKLDKIAFERAVSRFGRIPFRLRTYREDGWLEVGSYNGTPPWDSLIFDALSIIRHFVGERAIFDHDLLPGKKVYFPLHVQPEFTPDVRAPFCSNQLALIENIARSIPAGYRLVVKDHPAMRGRRTLPYYREIKKLRNVQLLSPGFDSHTVIQDSDAILTIVGTTAFEAILYEKPAIAFGDLVYGFFELLYRCRDLSQLPGVIAEALSGFTPDRELLLKFVWATIETAHVGEWADPLAIPRIAGPANVSAVAKAIVNEMEIGGRTIAAVHRLTGEPAHAL